jgi:two-component system chemotaxis response regulator CheB
MERRDIIVIGGSAGAASAMTALLKELAVDLPGTVFVALHLSPTTEEWLSGRFGRVTGLKVESPRDPQPIQAGTVYVAPPDRHLIVKPGHVLSSCGPRENMWRPAIDVLFRTAAVAYGSRVIGVLMSGELDDGTAGLQAIGSCGGIVIVQEPEEAEYPTMPRVALTNLRVDHRARLRDMAALLSQLMRGPAGPQVEVPALLRMQSAIAQVPEEAARLANRHGAPSPLNCPECGGPLWQDTPSQQHLRCMVGHAFHLGSLAEGAEQELDRTLWAAIRMFEQRANISRMMAERERTHGRDRRADLHESRARESHRYAQTLCELLAGLRPLPPEAQGR